MKKAKKAGIKTKRYERPDVRHVMRTILGGDLDWESLDEKAEESREAYAIQAQSILDNFVWQNEHKKLMDTLIRSMASEADSYEKLRDIRMCVNALELIDSRLRDIASWKGRTNEASDPFESI